MKRTVGFLVFVALIAGAIFVGLSIGPSSRPPTYTVREPGTGGRVIGSIVMESDTEICWDFSMDRQPQAMQLHQRVSGPRDPVAATFYEPSADAEQDASDLSNDSFSEPQFDPPASGCTKVARGTIDLVMEDPDAFYVDGHDTEDGPPVTTALMVEE